MGNSVRENVCINSKVVQRHVFGFEKNVKKNFYNVALRVVTQAT